MVHVSIRTWVDIKILASCIVFGYDLGIQIFLIGYTRQWSMIPILGTLRFGTIDGWTCVARCLGYWIEYGALWRVVARKLKLSCYTTNYVLREIAAVEFTLKMSFQKVRDELIYCFADGILDEEEFVLLYDAYKSTNSIYPYWEYDEFSLDSLSSDECLADFRVEKDDIPRLAEALRLPGRFRCSQGTLCSGLEGLCILLKRLAFPCRYYDMIYRFARPVPELCLIYNAVLRWVYENHGHRLTSWNQQFLSPIFLEQYARALQRMSAPLGNCFGFVDGTVWPISRPDAGLPPLPPTQTFLGVRHALVGQERVTNP